MLREITLLIKKDLTSELRRSHVMGGIFLYLASTVFVVFLALFEVEPVVWVSLYWIVILFTVVNAVAKSFLQESRGRWIYFYHLVSPKAVIFSKMIYNSLLGILLCTAGFFIFTLVIGNPMNHSGYFLFVSVVGTLSLVLVFTLMSAIAQQAGGSVAMMAILGLPLIIPSLMLLIHLSVEGLRIQDFPFPWRDTGLLLSVDVLVVTLGWLLFPYLWRE